jgi:hypothetical protein
VKKKVLHITAHMGGGVGKVISSVSRYANNSSSSFSHRIVLLEKPEKLHFVEAARREGVDVHICPDYREVGRQMQDADIVQLEWWHHPSMARFLRYFPHVAVRLVIWCHISGTYYPWLPFGLVRIPHTFLFTSGFSLENPLWSAAEKRYAETNCRVVNSSGGFDGITQATRKKSGDFTIGYVGTLSYTKLHPRFPDICS